MFVRRASQQTIFLLGATGYLGSQFLVVLAERQPRFHVVALLRNLGKEKELQSIYPNLSAVKGTLDDAAEIEEEASRAKYVINCASSNHEGSVKSILVGLKRQSALRPGDPPVYLHVSGLGIIYDNSRGELVEEDKIRRYTDIGFNLDQPPSDTMHLNIDKQIVEAGTRKENPIRTIIAYPGWIYGIGDGIQKVTAAIRGYLAVFNHVQYAGTWGPGLNSKSSIHVKDAANALSVILDAALQGKADEGDEGHYFIGTDGPYIPARDMTEIMGDVMYNHGIYERGGTRPLPPEATDLSGEFGWRLMGANSRIDQQRLKRLGWEPSETRKHPFLQSLVSEMELVAREQKESS